MRAFLLLLTLTVIPFSSRADEFEEFYSPINAYSLASDPVPENSRMAMPNEFYNRYKEGVLILDTPSRVAEDQQRALSEERQTSVRANAFLAFSRPTLAYRITGIRDGADAPVQLRTTRGETKKLVLMGRDAVLREVLGAQSMYMDRSNQRAIYEYLHTRMVGTPGLPTVSDIITADAAQFEVANTGLLQIFEHRFGSDSGGRAPEGHGICEAEEGAGDIEDADDGDQTGKFCEYSPSGLYAAGDWALKYANTCPRNQGERGTSAAFALTAAIESRVARDERRYSNFSEQHLFHLMTARWFRRLPDNQDNIAPILSSGISNTIGYRFHFEDIWSYNASYDRVEIVRNNHKALGKSCHWYDGRQCSETNHQGRMICVVVNQHRFCGYDAPMTIATPIKVSNMAVIFDVRNPAQSVDRARMWLRAGVPLVMTFGVPASLLNNQSGYVGAANEAERFTAGHAALISGFVPNHLRPPGAPEGAGGGYFVMKNSWGRCAGDSGYYYLSADWVRANALNMTAVF